MREDFYQDKTAEEINKGGFNKKEEECMPQKSTTRFWSVLAFVIGSLACLFCLTKIGGIIIGVVAVMLCLISRIKLGYFDRLSIAALIFGVFGASVSLLTTLFYHVPWLRDLVRFYL